GILGSQYRYIAGWIGGGPAVYAGRICAIMTGLIFYKALMGIILSIGGFLGIAILQAGGIEDSTPWKLAKVSNESKGNILICQEIMKQAKNKSFQDEGNDDNLQAYTQICQKILENEKEKQSKNKEQLTLKAGMSALLAIPILPITFSSTTYELIKTIYYTITNPIAMITYSILQVINLVVYILTVVFSIFWCFFIVLIYVMGPVAIVAGLLPSFGHHITMRWIYAVIQCAMWPPLIALIIVILASFQETQILYLASDSANYLLGNTSEEMVKAVKSSLITLGISMSSLVLLASIPFITTRLVPESITTSLMNRVISQTIGSYLNKIARA
ncbi:hypothetical protein D6810_03250, partial [Candidatus Dojkabacteria bacterium]